MENNGVVNKPSNELRLFVESLKQYKKPSELSSFIKSLDERKINLLTEIILNLLNNRINVNENILKKLSPFKRVLRGLIKKKLSYISRKKIFSSLKGLYILLIIIPTVFTSISEYF